MANIIATLSHVKEYLMKQPQSNQLTKDDERIKWFCQSVSDTLEERTSKQWFVPRRQTRYYTDNDIFFYHDNRFCKYNGDTLILDKEIVDVISLTTNNGNTAISSDNYFLRTADSYNLQPYTRIELSDNTTFNYSTFQKAHAVDGIWVNHDSPDNMWKLRTTVQDNPLLVSATTLNVTDASIFNVQELIRFGDDNTGEFASIEAIDVDNNTLTIERGVNGTTAVEQAQGVNIYYFLPRHDALYAATVWSAFEYMNKDNAGGSSTNQLISADGMVLSPIAMLPDIVRAFLARYRQKI